MQDVADILSTASPEPLPPDAAKLAAFARRQLREQFATADVGITGANFAIAETGTIVLVTNEGNGRLTTTLPRVHIAVMGMEKVIPRLADLPVFLKVLGRAATGQKLSIYTSLITGPRQPGELDGPEEFHLVILDNGRSRILGGPLRESLFCIRCGACLNACPIYRNVGGPCLRRRLCRADRRRAHAALRRPGGQPPSAARLQPLRRLPGGLPGEDRHSRNADPAARQVARTSRASWASSSRWPIASGPARCAAPVLYRLGYVAGFAHARPLVRAARLAEAYAGPVARLDARAATFPRPRQSASAIGGNGGTPVNREAFLARVREAAHQGRAYRVHLRDDLPPDAGYVGAGPDILDRLAAEIIGVGGQAHRVPDFDCSPRQARGAARRPLGTLGALLGTSAIRSSRARRIARVAECASESQTPACATSRWLSSGHKRCSAEIGITSTTFAIAETGTLAFASGPGTERMASLLPPVHVAIVEASQVLPDLFDLFARLEQEGFDRLATNVALITGPSKTGDIELKLTTGVHGPGVWHVIIIESAAG